MKRLAEVFLGVCLMLMVAVLPVKAQGEVFTSFDELKELAAGSYDSNTTATYQGEESLVIAENLELPENLSINIRQKVIIPEGVTFISNASMVTYDGLEVAGTLHLKKALYGSYLQVYDELTITGALLLDCSTLLIECPDNVTGIENMQRGEESDIRWIYSSGNSDTVKQVAPIACNNTNSNTYYAIHVRYGELLLDEAITIPENMYIGAHDGMTVTEDCVVDLKGDIYLFNACFVDMKGTMNNAGCIRATEGSDLYISGTMNNIGEISIGGSSTMTIIEDGEYIGSGSIYVYDVDDSAIASSVSGLDLSKFQVTEVTAYNSYWELHMKSDTRIAIESFVTRMYEQCLSRDPDQAGLDGWAGQLENGNMNGAQIAEQFVFSNEMLSKNLSDEEFVNVLYRAMMGREADEAGRAGWVNELSNGYLTRSEVTKAFVESTEFTNICTEYGITRGTYDASMAPIEHFVTRFYTLCLERKPDQAGLYGWVDNLKNQYMNGAQIADAFIFSDEFVNKNVSDEKYIELLYNTLLGRPSDENGKAGWLGELQNGYMTRRDMMKAFIESTEFTGICETYGITRGSL